MNNTFFEKTLTICNEMHNRAMCQKERVISDFQRIITMPLTYKYGVGGINIHRGWYCPSFILDIVIGNSSRGRLTNKCRANTKYNYRYCFDNSDLLTVSEMYLDGVKRTSEYIIEEKDKRIGFTFLNDNKLLRYSEECYEENFLISYRYIDYFEVDNVISHLYFEQYKKEGSDLSFFITEYDKDVHVSQREYSFTTDDEGFFLYYTVKKDEKEFLTGGVFGLNLNDMLLNMNDSRTELFKRDEIYSPKIRRKLI